MTIKTTVEEQWRGKEVKIKGKAATGRSAFEIGLIVEGQAKLLCAVDTGRLAASITTASFDKRSAESKKTSSLAAGRIHRKPLPGDLIDPPTDPNEVLVGTPVFYGPYIEFGVNGKNGQPFLRPGFTLAKGEALTIMMVEGRLQFKEFLVA